MVRMSGAMTLFFLQYLGDLTFVYRTPVDDFQLYRTWDEYL